MSKWVEHVERQELIQKLIDSGYGDLVESFLYNEQKVYTKKARLNKSGACRVMNCKTKQVEDALMECRRILGPDVFN